MIRTYRSKRSPFFVSWVAFMLLAMLLLFWFHYNIASLILLVFNVVLTRRALQTEYKLDSEGYLTIIRGVMPRVTISLAEVAEFTLGHYLYSPYALSSHGVWITLQSGRRLFISPSDAEQFIASGNQLKSRF